MKLQFAIILAITLISFTLFTPPSSFAQTKEHTFVYGDALPDAPELAARGAYQVGVQTLEFINPGQVDILNSKEGKDPLYDRPLTVEVWYPAISTDENDPLVTYDDVLGRAGDLERPVIPCMCD